MDADKIQEQIDKETENAWRALLRTPDGRLVAWSVLEMCHLYRSSFSTDIAEMAFQEGERSIGQQLLSRFILADGQQAYSQMLADAEHRAERIANAEKEEDEPDE